MIKKIILFCFIIFKIQSMELPEDTERTALEYLKSNAAFYIPEDLVLDKDDLFNALRQEGFEMTPVSAAINLKRAIRYFIKKKKIYRIHHAQLYETFKKVPVE